MERECDLTRQLFLLDRNHCDVMFIEPFAELLVGELGQVRFLSLCRLIDCDRGHRSWSWTPSTISGWDVSRELFLLNCVNSSVDFIESSAEFLVGNL